MPAPIIIKGESFESMALTNRCRITDTALVALLQADITSITCAVYSLGSTTPNVAVSTPTIVVASVIFDTLQSWATDSAGYNFLHEVPAGADSDTEPFALGNRNYSIEYVFNPVSGEDFMIIFEPKTKNTRT